MADSSPPAVTNATADEKIVVHHLNNSRSQRILWLLEELGLPYEIKHYTRTENRTAPEEMKSIHPLGLSPVVTIGNTTIAESGAIIEYIIKRYGEEKDRPTEEGYLDNLYFGHYSEGSLMPLLVNKLIFTMVPQRTPFFIRPIANMIFGVLLKTMVDPRLNDHTKYIEAHLSRSQTGWFANGEHPTSADYMMVFPLEGIQTRLPQPGSKIEEYLRKVHERPAYKRALERGGEFSLA